MAEAVWAPLMCLKLNPLMFSGSSPLETTMKFTKLARCSGLFQRKIASHWSDPISQKSSESGYFSCMISAVRHEYDGAGAMRS